MLVEAWTGSERARGVSAAMHMLWLPTRAHAGKETHVSKIIHDTALGVTKIRGSRVDAAPGKIDDYGAWYQTVYDMPEGLLFKLTASRVTAEFGRQSPRGALLLQTREHASQKNIIFRGSGSPFMGREEYTVCGRFDLLTIEEAEQLGAYIHPAFRLEYSPRSTENVYSIGEVSPEISPRPRVITTTVINQAGKPTEVVSSMRRRKIAI